MFQYQVGSGRVLEKIPGYRSGKSSEIYDRIISGIFFTLGYFWVFLGIYDIISFHGGREPNIKMFSKTRGC